MRLRNIPGAREAVAASPFCVSADPSMRGKWRSLFGEVCALHLEIGSGKGRFLIEQAKRRKECAFLGMERTSTVMYKALKKLGREEEAPGNLRFVLADAMLLESLFAAGEVDRIYLNFSDPWPKERHAMRRLTGAAFLARYARVLARDGVIEVKTDNRALFDWSEEQVRAAGWRIEAMTHDLHADEHMRQNNVMTEYEERFSALGHPICKMIIRR